jgi:hypothetical protein
MITADVLAKNIGAERTDQPFLRFKFKANTQCIAQHFKVFGLCPTMG